MSAETPREQIDQPPKLPQWITYLVALAPVIGPVLGFLAVVVAAFVAKL